MGTGTLRGKLISSFIIAIFFVALVGFAGWAATATAERGINRIYNDNLMGAVYLARAQDSLWKLRYNVSQFLVVDEAGRQKILAEDPGWYKSLNESLAKYEKTELSDNERRALVTLRENYRKYEEARPRWLELQGSGHVEEAAAWRAQTIFPYGAATVKSFADQISLQQVAAENTRNDTAK